MPAPLVPYDPKKVTAFSPEEAAALSKSTQDLKGTDLTASSTFDQHNVESTGFSSSFLGDAATDLDTLNKQLIEAAKGDAELAKATKETGASRIRSEFERSKEEILANQKAGFAQIGYAQERLGGAVVLKRRVDDFTQAVTDFTKGIDNSLERLTIAEEDALATNDQNYLKEIRTQKLDLITAQRQALTDKLDIYMKVTTMALQQHEEANKQLDTMLQWATLDNATPDELESIAKATGFSVDQLKAMGATAQQTFNASMASKRGTGVTYPSALLPWQGTIDASLQAGLSVAEAIQDAITEAHNRGVELSDADISALSTYATNAFNHAQAAAKAAEAKAKEDAEFAGKTKPEVKPAEFKGFGGGTRGNVPTPQDIFLEGIANSLFGSK